MLKILQARLQQYVNPELPDVQAGFRKGRGTRDPLPTSAESLQKQDSSSAFIDYTKDSECMYHNKLCKILQEMGIPDHVTCLLRNLCPCQKAVSTGHGRTDWFQIRKGVRHSCTLSPCLFNLYAEYIMRNAGLDET